MKTALIPFLILFFFSLKTPAQTTSVVYSEDFNSGNGGWMVGGYRPSWNWGIPSLPNIVSNGTPCMVTADAGSSELEPFASCPPYLGSTANGNYYNCCERSYVMSPSIDLSGVFSPLLSIDINMHCEQTFDGAKVQFSTDGGVSWDDVGSNTSSSYLTFPFALNCREQNWYNRNSVNYLGGSGAGCSGVNVNFGGGNSGWSGGCAQSGSGACASYDGHGTNGWITATHCLTGAANQPDVKIRIAFGAGSQVYADGIAFDNVRVFDVYPEPGFTAAPALACGPAVQFTQTTGCARSWSWDFGHPLTGGNTSSDSDPLHLFPDSGDYQVTLTTTDYCGGVSSYALSIPAFPVNTILTVETFGDTTIRSGSGTMIGAVTNQPATFEWSPVSGLTDPFAPQTMAAPGETTTYTVTATDTNGCTNTDQVSIVVTDPVLCNQHFVPNTFTPNGDGKNERFQVHIDPDMNLVEYSLAVYNRWGQPVFTTREITGSWTGAGHPQGMYTVVADFTCKNKSKSRYTGTVNLIR